MELARALVRDARLVALDEPTATWQEIAKGAIILFAVTFDVWTKRGGGHHHA